ncbi:chitin-binding type-2 domain-containing protein [Caerostris extrusa]|uniref:Chitin-binding type-2 domain-containing protein n=1 Tax=Caerostris extrusa TaxID=172846 RepID=A0AAV4RA04_CAEEX|nr:chitin-binding type-2 domain-containing protein [Caerostris extrusa]
MISNRISTVVLLVALASTVVEAFGYRSSKKFKPKDGLSFKCPMEYGIFANPENCRRFYTCNGNIAYDTPCPTPLYFDDAKKLCVYKTADLQCGPVPVTTPVPTTPDPNAAPTCQPEACKLPDCFCSEDGTLIPGDLRPDDVPQMVILTFSGALNVLNGEPFQYLLNDTKLNPNGCPVKATFFVPHEYTSYYYVQKLYGQGHEIAAQSITNREPEDYWSIASNEEWVEEVIGVKEILHNFANVSREDILGMRAPFLKPGGNKMLEMIYDYGLDYDSSLAAPLSEVPLWPYTLDFRHPHKCLAANCPTRSFPGIWEFPLNTQVSDDETGSTCVFLDQCVFPDDPEAVYDFLAYNFERHYSTNKAPLVLNFHVNWVIDDNKAAALDVFIDSVLETYPDAWFVTMQQAIQWMRNPMTSEMAKSFEGWKCPRTRMAGCNIPRTCRVKLRHGTRVELRYLQVCGRCPERYPWLNNVRGDVNGKSVKDLVQKATV